MTSTSSAKRMQTLTVLRAENARLRSKNHDCYWREELLLLRRQRDDREKVVAVAREWDAVTQDTYWPDTTIAKAAARLNMALALYDAKRAALDTKAEG